ncbi:hypothetical protein SAMN04488696_0642 [Methanolobus profundi]|uniref:Uncharacterized protein n=2 Tax=Methanolobus profundi TaxID=487685 RepID=A0A1I4PGF5_9EURY|nr:hypothetical protein SAMN04488696_0642 [Methanolobus profundi]
MFRKSSILILYVILCFYSIAYASAVGVGVSPANMTFDAHVGITNEQSLFVINDGSGISDYRVYVDDQFVEWFTISPNNFTLDPGEHKEVIIGLKAPISANGNYDLKAYVIASAPSSDFEVGSGIKIPVDIKLSNDGLFFASGALAIILIGTIVTGSRWNKNRIQNRKNVTTDEKIIADELVTSSIIEEIHGRSDKSPDMDEITDDTNDK